MNCKPSFYSLFSLLIVLSSFILTCPHSQSMLSQIFTPLPPF